MNQATLGILLAVQLIVIVVVWTIRSSGGEEPEAFLSFDAPSVDRVRITGEDNGVTLTRIEDGWQLEGGLPADSSKVDKVVEKLASAAGGWPVATSTSALVRFEVTDDEHQRRVIVNAGDETLADIFLGTSPGYRKVHARHASGGAAYAIEFSNYEAGTEPTDWLKKTLLQPDGKLQSVARDAAEAAWNLTSTEDGWTADGVNLDQDEVSTLIGRFEGLRVLDLVDAELPATPKMRFTLIDDGGAHEIAFFHLEEEDDYVATSNRFEGRFEVATYIAEQLDVSLGDLLASENDEEATEDFPSASTTAVETADE